MESLDLWLEGCHGWWHLLSELISDFTPDNLLYLLRLIREDMEKANVVEVFFILLAVHVDRTGFWFVVFTFVFRPLDLTHELQQVSK